MTHQRRLSIEVWLPLVPLDDVIERASYGLLEERVATPSCTVFTTRPQALKFGAPLFASANISATNASNEGNVDLVTFFAMQSRAEGAEKELEHLQSEDEKLKNALQIAEPCIEKENSDMEVLTKQFLELEIA